MNDELPIWVTDPELTNLRTSVFRGVGKSIYLYQEIEKRIKLLNTTLSIEISGPQSEWSEQFAKHQGSFDRHTMGTLMRGLLEKLYFSPDSHAESQVTVSESNEIKMKWRFSLQTTAEYIHERRETIETFVQERNRLVHTFYEDVNFSDATNLKQMIEILEAQHQKIDAELKILNRIIQLINESSIAESEWWNSEDGAKQMEIIRLQNSVPINFLEWYPARHANTKGWTVFQLANAELKKQQPLEVESFFKTFPFKSLRAAAIACGLFDFKDEKTAKGHRTMYRVKSAGYEYTSTFQG